MDHWQLFQEVSQCFAGFSLERRQEWSQHWRVRILPNKQERQNFRIEVYSDTAEEALQLALEQLQAARAACR